MSVNEKGLHFEVVDFIGLFNFQWHGQSEVGNIAIVVLWRHHKKLYCNGDEILIHCVVVIIYNF